MEGDCNVYAHSSLWMRPTRPDRYNAKMVYTLGSMANGVADCLSHKKKKKKERTRHVPFAKGTG